MRTVKDTYLVEQDYSHATALSLAYLRPQLFEEGFDVAPPDVPTGWMRENCFERALALALHLNGTVKWYYNANRCDLLTAAQR